MKLNKLKSSTSSVGAFSPRPFRGKSFSAPRHAPAIPRTRETRVYNHNKVASRCNAVDEDAIRVRRGVVGKRWRARHCAITKLHNCIVQ